MSEQTLPTTSQEEAAREEVSTNRSIADLEPGMELMGKVKSTTDFGAFIDLGLAQDGLVHISQLARRRVQNVADVVKINDDVQVWVKKVDKKRGRISLTMIKPVTRRFRDLNPDMVIEGKVTRIEPYGVFVDIGTGRDGLVHVSELANGYISSPSEVVSVGDKAEVRVLKVDRKARRVDLTMKEFMQAAPAQKVNEPAQESAPAQTVMALAFQEAIKDDGKKKQRGIDELIANSLKR